MLVAFGPFLNTMGPEAQLAAAQQLSFITTEIGTSILTTPGAILNFAQQFSDFLPFGDQLEDAFASVEDLPAQILQINPCALPGVADALGDKCSFADLGDRLPELIGYLEELDGLGNQLGGIRGDIQSIGSLGDLEEINNKLTSISGDIRGRLFDAAAQTDVVLQVASEARDLANIVVFDLRGTFFESIREIQAAVKDITQIATTARDISDLTFSIISNNVQPVINVIDEAVTIASSTISSIHGIVIDVKGVVDKIIKIVKDI